MFVRACLAFALFVPLLRAQSPEPFRFVAIGDTGSGSKAQGRVAERMWEWREKNPFQVVLMLGDNIYGDHEISGGGDPRWFPQKFDAFYERFLEQGVVFHAVIGNHDMQTNHGQAEIDDQSRFGILGDDGYYKFSPPQSFDVAGRPLAEFFAINSELRGEKMTRQVTWLKDQLSASSAVWKFVYLHHPLYTVRGQHDPAVALRRLIRESLRQNHVQFILAGHNHFYARLKPVDQTMQLISGGGGRHLAFPRLDHCAEISQRKYHFLGVAVYPDQVHFTAVDQLGEVFDEKSVDSAYLETVTEGCPTR